MKKARLLHPDQLADRPKGEQQRAERRMQELNNAWSVLSDEGRRREYDSKMAESSPRATGAARGAPTSNFRPFDASEGFVAPTRPSGPKVADESDMEITGFARLMRVGPLVALLGTFLAILVVTAVLGGRDTDTDEPRPSPVAQPTGTPQQCINISPVVEPTSCAGRYDAIVWTIATEGNICPDDLEGIFRPQTGGQFCVTLVDR